jgi:hypothetical protein
MRRRHHQDSRPTITPIISTGPVLATEIHDDDTTVFIRRDGDQITIHQGFGIGSVIIGCEAARALAVGLVDITREATR